MTEQFLESAEVIEFLCVTTKNFVEEVFGDDCYLNDEHGSTYTEEAQNYFDRKYDDIEYDLSNLLEAYAIEYLEEMNTADHELEPDIV